MKSKTVRLLLIVFVLSILITGCSESANVDDNKTNHYKPYTPVSNIESGIQWPKGQALPTFATPETTLDTILISNLSPDEQITFSALQGIVNKEKPRIYLLDSGADEGAYTWSNTFEIERNNIKRKERFSLVSKYKDEVKGVVLYDAKKNAHYRNLASTVAGIKEALPMTAKVYEDAKAEGIEFEVVEDLTTLTFKEENDIYNYMYDTYWKDCEKRAIISADPKATYSQVRDLAAATGAAVVYPNTQEESGKNILRKFFGDMTPGEAIILGWYTTERSGINVASEFGIGTLPANFYISSTVYSGMDHKIQIPEVPKRQALENKAYISIFISDGDNIQYMQRAMRKKWDEVMKNRGEVPLNWTMSPSMVDVGPGLLNYYYTNSTENDCFVTGPSGLGYMMPFNTLNEDGAPVGEYLTEKKYADGYTQLTETYLQRSGVRVITIWDNASSMVRASYEENIRNLYGATVQDFGGIGMVKSSVEDNRVPFEKLVFAYTGKTQDLKNSIMQNLNGWDKTAPLFLSYQIDIWSISPSDIVKLSDEINGLYPDKVEFVRADHYFNLQNEANHIPFNLNMSEATTATSSNSDISADVTTDGTPVTMWEDANSEEKWLAYDFGDSYNISRYVIRHAGENGLPHENNTSDYRVLASTDNENWTTIDTYVQNKINVTDIEFEPVSARYIKIVIDNPGADSVARIADVEIYGSK